jgi:hypothetical protein
MKKLTIMMLSTKPGLEYWEFGFAIWNPPTRAHMAALFAAGYRIHADQQTTELDFAELRFAGDEDQALEEPVFESLT